MGSGEPSGGIGEDVVSGDHPVQPLPFGADGGPGIRVEIDVVSDPNQRPRGVRQRRGGSDEQDGRHQQAGSASDSPDSHHLRHLQFVLSPALRPAAAVVRQWRLEILTATEGVPPSGPAPASTARNSRSPPTKTPPTPSGRKFL